MGIPSSSPRGNDRHERRITVAFALFGALLLATAVYWAVTSWGDLQLALVAAGERSRPQVVMHELNREILAAFVGAVFFASGVLRWRESAR